MQFTTEKVAQDYLNLAHPNPQVREQANIDLLNFKSSSQAWLISKELLNVQVEPNLQFLGAQVLYLKIRTDYAVLQEQEIDEIKQYVLENVYEGQGKFNQQTFKQLCTSASVIGLKMIQNNWKDFIQDMINLGTSSPQNLLAALEILAGLCRELQGVDVQLSLVQDIRGALTPSKDIVADFLRTIILDADRDVDITNKALECVSSWAQIRAFEILQYPGLIESMLKKIDSEQTVSWAIEALSDGLKNSVHSDILSTTRMGYASNVLPAEVRESLRKIIKYLYDIHLAQKDLNTSPFCWFLCELAVNIGQYFNIIILENSEHSKALLQFLLMCTSHVNKKTSSNTFEFWGTFAKDITRKDMLAYTKDPKYDFVVEAYIELFKSIIEKCRLKSLKVISFQEALKLSKIFNIDTEHDEDFDEDDFSLETNKKDISVREYRISAQEAFESFYTILSRLKDEEGIKAVFALVVENLTKDEGFKEAANSGNLNLKMEYILTCEALMFAVRSMLEIIEDSNPNYYVMEMLKNVINLPKEDVLVRQILNFISESTSQLRNIPEAADELFSYCIEGIANPYLTASAANCFETLSETLGDKISLQTLERIIEIMDNAVYAIEDPTRSAQCISAVFHIGRGITNYEMKVKFLQRALKSIQEKFQLFTESLDKSEGSILNDASVKADALKLFIILASILQGFELENQGINSRSTKVIEETILPFMLQSINYICLYLELFSNHEEFIVTFSKLIKMSVRICGMKLENFYEKMLYSTLKVFEMDPFRNISLLDTINTLVVDFENSTKQKEWLFNNLSSFNTFMFQSLIKNYEQSNEMFLKWIDILSNILHMYRDFFLELKEVGQIIDLVIRAFYEFQEHRFLKKLTHFLVTFIGVRNNIKAPIVLNNLPKILAFALIRLPDIDTQRIKLLSKVVIAILCGLEDQEAYIIELFFSVLAMDRYSDIGRQQKELFLKSMFLYRNDDKIVTSLVQHFARYATDPTVYTDSIMWIQMKILEKQRDVINQSFSRN